MDDAETPTPRLGGGGDGDELGGDGSHLWNEQAAGEEGVGGSRLTAEEELSRPLSAPRASASWSNRNMTATQPVAFVDLPSVQARKVSTRWQQIDRARVKVTRAYRQNPEAIGIKWVKVWTGRSTRAAGDVYRVMVSEAFKPIRGDRYRWYLVRRGREIYGLLMPRNEMEWTDEQVATYEAFRASNKRSLPYQEELSIESDAESDPEVDPDDLIEGTNSQQKYRYKKGHGNAK